MRGPLIQPNALRRLALPNDHGSWVFLATPLLIGLLAGGSPSAASVVVVAAALAAFLIRQPVTGAVKALSGRRPREDLPLANFWIVVYGTGGLAAAGALAAMGRADLFWLAAPAAPVFAWHLILVGRRSERRQFWVEVLGSGALALSATALAWAAAGAPTAGGIWLGALTWAQAAASIAYAYLRLAQRPLPAPPTPRMAWRMAAAALAWSGANTLATAWLARAGTLPAWLWVAFAIQFAECVFGALRPAIGVRPALIGMRQTIVSALFALTFVAAWRFGPAPF